MKNEIVLFTDGDINIEVQINPELETVWLTQKQMEVLFDVKHATVSEHISNIIASGELDETSVGFSDKSTGGRKPKIYNLDMILSVGYRVNSKRGIAFRKWANNVLKEYILKGYAINEKRLQALSKEVRLHSQTVRRASFNPYSKRSTCNEHGTACSKCRQQYSNSCKRCLHVNYYEHCRQFEALICSRLGL